jgi:hypothetical protein
LRESLDLLEEAYGSLDVIHGACPNSPDEIADLWAFNKDRSARSFHADWDRHGKKAGFIRNSKMIDEKPALVLAGWNGTSNGTLDTIRKATKAGIPVRIVPDLPTL